jgi:uncharacterized YigZ family protein
MEKLLTVLGETSTRLEIKKSQFIAHLVPFSEFQTLLSRLKEEHRKARHFVWATRTLNEQNQIVENCSDDGEPRNTSGKPTLKVLQGHQLIDAALITVRYFGGIKLGTGGLVRAYNDAGQLAVQAAALIPLGTLYCKTVRIPYQQIRHTEHQLKQYPIKVLHKEFAATHIDLTLQGDRRYIDKAFEQIVTLTREGPGES